MQSNFRKLSVIIPVYNEALAVPEVLRRVFKAPLPEGYELDVVVVNDGSTDTTKDSIREFTDEHPDFASRVTFHDSYINHGKGAALRAGFKIAKGDIFLVQDGDLEYSPNDYPNLLAPFENPEVSVVYGSRFMNGWPKGMKRANLLANRILSWTARLLYGQRISDEACGYKVFRREVLDNFELSCRRFEFCPEFTGRVRQAGYRIYEVPIEYNPRGVLEGKKIKASDGFVALWWLIKVRFSRPEGGSTEA
jgi:dolichol-phosphate mannosyltransferase